MSIEQKIFAEMEARGFELKAVTSGSYSFRKGSNLQKAVVTVVSKALLAGYEDYPVFEVRVGAKKRFRSEGNWLYVFLKRQK